MLRVKLSVDVSNDLGLLRQVFNYIEVTLPVRVRREESFLLDKNQLIVKTVESTGAVVLLPANIGVGFFRAIGADAEHFVDVHLSIQNVYPTCGTPAPATPIPPDMPVVSTSAMKVEAPKLSSVINEIFVCRIPTFVTEQQFLEEFERFGRIEKEGSFYESKSPSGYGVFKYEDERAARFLLEHRAALKFFGRASGDVAVSRSDDGRKYIEEKFAEVKEKDSSEEHYYGLENELFLNHIPSRVSKEDIYRELSKLGEIISTGFGVGSVQHGKILWKVATVQFYNANVAANLLGDGSLSIFGTTISVNLSVDASCERMLMKIKKAVFGSAVGSSV